MLTQERLKSVLSYDAETGAFIWKDRPVSDFKNIRSYKMYLKVFEGKYAGCAGRLNYIFIRVDYHLYRAHRLAWLYETGLMPEKEIDHINGIPNDNRIINLREATDSENNQNLKKAQKNNKTGLLGASFDKSRNKYEAQIMIGRKKTHIGRFNTAEEAHQAYLERKRELHPFGTL